MQRMYGAHVLHDKVFSMILETLVMNKRKNKAKRNIKGFFNTICEY